MSLLEIDILCPQDFKDILLAEFSQIGFEGFLETDDGFKGYMDEAAFQSESLAQIALQYKNAVQFTYVIKKIKQKNWNQQWEKDYHPVIIDNEIIIRASFHKPRQDYPYNIVINPKMSFGTGHHETTSMMLALQLQLDHHEKSILDVGCGTGILTIMAWLRGAKLLAACDVDPNCIENSQENFALNGCHSVLLKQGDINIFHDKYHIILANINRNVLLDNMAQYSQLLSGNGNLLVSGFYESDEDKIIEAAAGSNFKVLSKKLRNQWAAILFGK